MNRKSTRTFTRLQKKTDTCRNFPVTVVLEYFKRHNHKNHRDAQISITISSFHPSSLKFQTYFSFAALLTRHFRFSSRSTDFSAHSQVFCDVKFCEANTVTCALPQQKLHSKCKPVCSFANVLSHCTDPPCYETKPHSLQPRQWTNRISIKLQPHKLRTFARALTR